MSCTYARPKIDLITTLPADGLAPNGATPSAGKVMITKFDGHDFFSHSVFTIYNDSKYI